jgi:hypothetical protein
MPTQTHEAYWATLMQAHATRQYPQARRTGLRTRWTAEDVLACLKSWAHQEGRQPTSLELGAKNLLPSYNTVTAVMGSVKSAYEQLGLAYPGPRCPHMSQQGTSKTKKTTNRQCLACDGWFGSPDPQLVRICTTCKTSPEWGEDGSWMNRTAVTALRQDIDEFWMETTL